MDKACSTDVFSSIFGSSTQGLSLFSNNAFRRQKPTIPEEGHVELNRAQKGSARVSKDQPVSVSVKIQQRDQIRVSEVEAEQEGYRSKKKKKIKISEQVSSEPPSENKELENLSGSGEAVSRKKTKLGRSSEVLDKSLKVLGEKEKGLTSQETVLKKKSKQQQESVEPVMVQMVDRGEGHDHSHKAKQGKWAIESGVLGRKEKYGKRGSEYVFEPHKPTKRQKVSSNDGVDDHALSQNPPHTQTAHPIQLEGGSKKTKAGGTKRKKEDSLEARYEKKLRGSDDIVTASQEPRPASATKEEQKVRQHEGPLAKIKKRKRDEDDENVIAAKTTRTFDADEKLKRTIFVGNLPLTVKRKVLIKEFSVYGPVESVRLRSVPLLDTKIPRRGAIIKGQINEAVSSQHAYVVFKTISHANDALAHNMKELCGNHVRVDAAYAPHQAVKGKSSFQYDHRRSIFVGNIPFDVKDEELYQTFGSGKSPEMDIEAVRVVRDPQTSLSKGIAYVLFKTKEGAVFYLSNKRKVKLRNRILRISRVMGSQTMLKQPSLIKPARKWENTDNSQSQRKRAKISASYEGVRATKATGQGKEKQKAANRSSGQQHVNGSLKGRDRGLASMVGAKRKRAEKKQRGISRSKKIRRT